MRKRIFNLAALISFALLCVVAVALFAAIIYHRGRNPMTLDEMWIIPITEETKLYIAPTIIYLHRGYPAWPVVMTSRPTGEVTDLNAGICRFVHSEHQGGYIMWTVVAFLPAWLLILSIAPGIWFICWRQAKRRSLVGCCVRCGYDLRGSPSACPECGAVVAKVSAK